MKFPRNAKILGSPFEIAPFASVFFLLVLFIMLFNLMPTPGLPVRLEPPRAADLPGIDTPSVAVGLDSSGRLFYQDQLTSPRALRSALAQAARQSHAPITLVIHADKTVTCDELLQLTLLARDAGIPNALLATLPRDIAPTVRP
ncbi:MAG: biopolymer transporter ExbD [Verrucomicrobiota bacterium]|nr:biopolymer transporter ExbD [Verrucomicrobiota bacterium]